MLNRSFARRGISWLVGLVAIVGVATEASAADVCYSLPFSNPNLADGWGSTKPPRTNPHRGVDFPQAGGTPIPAVAAGTVALVTFSSCLGNVIVLRHADGMFSGYSHMQAKATLAVGTSVGKGQTVGRVGTTGTCTTGNHLHLSLGPTVGSYGSGVTVDPYKYIQAHKTCDCKSSAGGFTFNCAGPIAGETCVNVNEPADTHSWSDNFLCTKASYGLAWSSAGPIAGKRCTNITEPSGADGPKWADNFLCVDESAPVQLSWTYDGSTKGKTCVAWNEPADPDTWTDNFLCIAPYAPDGGAATPADPPGGDGASEQSDPPDLSGVDTMTSDEEDGAAHAEDENAGCSTSPSSSAMSNGAATSLLAIAFGTLVASVARRRRRR